MPSIPPASPSTRPSAPVCLPSNQEPVLRVMASSNDTNIYGDVFGGWIMGQVDIAGSIAAARRAGGRTATVAVNAFQFKLPVYVGDLLSFYATVIQTGTTSITVEVNVYAQRLQQRQSQNSEVIKVTEATLTYVATDENHRSRPIPAL